MFIKWILKCVLGAMFDFWVRWCQINTGLQHRQTHSAFSMLDRRPCSKRWSFMSWTAAQKHLYSKRVYASAVPEERAALVSSARGSFIHTRSRPAPTTEKKILFSLCCDFAMSTSSISQSLHATNSNGDDDANAEAESYSKWATKRGDKTRRAAHNSEKGPQNSSLWRALFALHVVMISLKIWDLIMESLAAAAEPL